MSPEPPTQPEEAALVIRSQTALTTIPVGGMPVLSEIVNRSLVHIRTSRVLATPERRSGEECDFEIAPGVSIVMCWIPPGDFLMGIPEDEENLFSDNKQHRVQMTKGFWLAKTPITQAQWEAVMGNNPSHFEGAERPVESVSWLDICGDEKRMGGFLGAVNRHDPNSGRFDLPTEAQWEYACRAGTTGSFAGAPNLDQIAWYWENRSGRTQPVGRKGANAWGLHDMLGNVWEWCADWYGGYSGQAETDPAGPSSGLRRVYRGGCWSTYAFHCSVANRGSGNPTGSGSSFGFRIVRSSVP